MAVTDNSLYNTAGIRLPKDACIVVVRTEWNAAIVDRLEAGCCELLTGMNVAFKVITVPGAFEIPFAVKSYWDAYCVAIPRISTMCAKQQQTALCS
jgi:6,7-dimethyl-8-ribityllumazine synthase